MNWYIKKYNKKYNKYLLLTNKLNQQGGKSLSSSEQIALENNLESLIDTIITFSGNFDGKPVTNFVKIGDGFYKKEFANSSSIYLKKQENTYMYTTRAIIHPETHEILPNTSWQKLNWVDFKSKFSSNEITLEQMAFINSFRKQIVDNMLQSIFAAYPDCIVGNQQTSRNICTKNISGSDATSGANLLSDYDLTITGHFQVSKIIAIFNSVIMKKFGSEPFNVFDTNLYGYSFMIPHNDTFGNNLTWPLDMINDRTKKYNYLRIDGQIKSFDQDVWAYRRLLSFVLETGTKYKIILENVNQKQWYEQQSTDGNWLHDLHNMKDSEKSASYLSQMENFENLMNIFLDKHIKGGKFKIKTTTRGNGGIEVEQEIVLDIKDVQEKMIDALSNMNYFGDETYFTQGCFVHVVGTMFYFSDLDMTPNGKPKLLTISQLIHSLVENLAYFLHAYDKKGVIVAVKYMQRFINAYHMIKVKTLQTVSQTLHKLESYLNFIKLHIRNLSDIEIYNKLANHPEYQEYFARFGIKFNENINFSTVMAVFKKSISNKLAENFISLLMSEGIIVNNNFSTDDYYLYGLFELLRTVVAANVAHTNITVSVNADGIYHVNINENEQTPAVIDRNLRRKTSISQILSGYKNSE